MKMKMDNDDDNKICMYVCSTIYFVVKQRNRKKRKAIENKKAKIHFYTHTSCYTIHIICLNI